LVLVPPTTPSGKISANF
ncbi:unnamed protein product, partial [Rotaria sordida]